jgi:hypothetical protein
MRKPMTATELRKDEVRVTGIPQQAIVPEGERRLRLADLPRREALNCTPDELVETSWEWS